MMAGVAPASDQADEARFAREDRLERLHEVGRVVVCVHDVCAITERSSQSGQRRDGLWPLGSVQAGMACFHEQWPET